MFESKLIVTDARLIPTAIGSNILFDEISIIEMRLALATYNKFVFSLYETSIGLILNCVSLICTSSILFSFNIDIANESRLAMKTFPVLESTSIPHGLSVLTVEIILFLFPSIIETVFEK